MPGRGWRAGGSAVGLLAGGLLAGCADERGQRPAEAEVGYAGYVWASPAVDEAGEGTLLTGAGAEVAFTVLSGDRAGEGIAAAQPYAAYPGWWAAELPAGEDVAIRIAGEGLYPARWRAAAPGSDGGWYSGALFGAEAGWADALFAAVDPGARALSAGATHVWGAPLDPENWDCAAVRVTGAADAAGDGAVRCFDVSEEGAMTPVVSGSFDWFFALDVAPGEVAADGTGRITVDSGLGWEASYTAAEGEVVMALWLRGVAE